MEHFGPKTQGLNMEGNYYYNNAVCGIGFHGDTERRKVIGIRLGANLPIHFQRFLRHQTYGDPYVIPLDGGDMYVMSEKAVGADWKSSSILTLRHAVGLRFTTVKSKGKAKCVPPLDASKLSDELCSSELADFDAPKGNRKLRIVSILVKNRRATKQLRDLEEKGYTIIDVTSKSETHAHLSPFSPQGGIRVGTFVSDSVEGLYQGLKVFQEKGIDVTKFRIRNMKNPVEK